MEIEIGQVIQQGEVRIKRLTDVPEIDGLQQRKRGKNGFILAHSESGHHHLLTGGDVLERPSNREGLEMLYAILDKPEQVIQDAASPHDAYTLPPGAYDIRISREFNPFAEQARRVAD